jgi:hypothetical protein
MENESRKCPHCGAQVEKQALVCPNCLWKLNWMDVAENKYVEYLQTPMPSWFTSLVFLVAVVGQLMLLSTCDFFVEVIPYSRNVLIWGHILKTVGESILLLALFFAMRYEMRRMSLNILAAMLLLLAYHVCVVVLLLTQIGPVSEDSPLYPYCFYLMPAGECALAILGLRLSFFYNAQLSITGMAMIAASIIHLGFNYILHMSGHEVYVDLAVAIATILYFWSLRYMLIDHDSYMRMKRTGHTE